MDGKKTLILDNIKNFIETHINLIDKNDFKSLYKEYIKLHWRSCSPLTELLLDAGIDPLNYLDVIPERYLAYYDKLSSLTIPDNIKVINSQAFINTPIELLYISEGVDMICMGAFEDCGLLSTLHLPSSLCIIDKGAFRNSFRLKNISYNGTVEDWNKIRINITSFATGVNDYKYVSCLDGKVPLRTS